MKRYTPTEKKWLIENYPKLGSKKCMDYLHRSKASICQTANRLGCSVDASLKNKLHSETLILKFSPTIIPEIFRDVNTKEAAYVLGILWADGWVQSKNDYSINIKLISEDFMELLPIFYTLGEWKRYDYFPKNRKPTTQLRISGKILVDYFLSLDYHSKSIAPATKVLSTIPEHLKRYWWRGYFDGDGYISASHPYRLEFSSSWNQDWSFLPLEFKFKTQVSIGKHSYSKSRLCSKQEILKFGKILWDNWDNMGLQRKYNTYVSLYNKTNVVV